MSTDDIKSLPRLTAIDLERCVSIREAADLKGISPDGIRRYYGHLIRRPSPRRATIKLRDLFGSEGGAA